MEVVWNGTMERQAIEAERRQPPASDESHAESQADIVFDVLRELGEATAPQIAEHVSFNPTRVNSALQWLRRRGLVVVTDREPVKLRFGMARWYRAVAS